jgi:NAD(P)-dependent dehydrogenase (short-subunit alcohol dehydrogenase family)
MKSRRIDGQVLLITGATQGLGAAIAHEAAALGAAGLCITGRSEERGRRVAEGLVASGCPAAFVAADLGDEAATRAVFDSALKRFGRVDGLVNSAALTDRGTIESTPVELWDRLFAVNVRAPFVLMQEFVRHAKARGGGGCIVNIITRSAHGGQPFLTAYSASKGALATLTRNVANAVRGDRIRVNDWLVRAEPKQPFGRILKPDDVSALVLHLLSPAGEMMTGSVIDFDQNVMGAYD